MELSRLKKISPSGKTLLVFASYFDKISGLEGTSEGAQLYFRPVKMRISEITFSLLRAEVPCADTKCSQHA